MAGLDFTANGREIIFSSDQTGKNALWRIAASAGARPQPLALIGEDGIEPQVSRRSGRLVYRRQTTATKIWRVPVSVSAAGASPAGPFLSSSRAERTPQFSPDGRKIAFESDRAGSWEIWVANADGSNEAQLTSFRGSGSPADPAWSPRSDRLAFEVLSPVGVNSHRAGDRRLPIGMTGKATIYWSALSSGQPLPLIEGFRPSWSHDGNWIYFVSDRSGSAQVWKISPAGGQPVQVTRDGGLSPMESPNGKFLYYAKGPDLRSVWRIPVAGGEEGNVLSIQGAWSAYTLAGEGIYYISGTLSRSQSSLHASIEFFRPETGARKHIAAIEKPVWWGSLSVSPDRQSLFYTRLERQTSELMLVENFR
jgi:hypothetical protein